MDTPLLANQQKIIFISSVKNYQEQCQWPIGMYGKKVSSGSVMLPRLDDDMYACVWMFVYCSIKQLNK